MKASEFLRRHSDIGILVLRLVIGLSFILIPGLMKVRGGPELWKQVGSAMSNLGINFAPVFWGFMATLSEFAGGILILLGLFIRPAAAFLAFTMFVATMHHFSAKDPWHTSIQPIEMLAVFIALFFLGAGKYSLNYLIFKKE